LAGHDVKQLLKKFAFEESFSRDTKGGGPEHNVMLIPFWIAVIDHLLKLTKEHDVEGKSGVLMEEEMVSKYLDQMATTEGGSPAKGEEPSSVVAI